MHVARSSIFEQKKLLITYVVGFTSCGNNNAFMVLESEISNQNTLPICMYWAIVWVREHAVLDY